LSFGLLAFGQLGLRPDTRAGDASSASEPQCYVDADPKVVGETCIDIIPETTPDAPIGTEIQLTVKLFVRTIEQGDVGFPDADIWLKVVDGPNDGTERTGKTDSLGNFTTTYTSNGVSGIDEIRACWSIPDAVPQEPGDQRVCVPTSKVKDALLYLDIALVNWIDATPTPSPQPTPKPTPPTPGGQCFDVTAGNTSEYWCIGIDPKAANNTVGSEQTFTASITLDGTPQHAVPVGIEIISGPNSQTVSAVAAGTDNNGEVSLTYTGNGGPGTDVIRACRASLSTASCTSVVSEATVVWTAVSGASSGSSGQQQGTQGSSGGEVGVPSSGTGSLTPVPRSVPTWPALLIGIGLVGLLVGLAAVVRVPGRRS
jgi:hypothetical protein